MVDDQPEKRVEIFARAVKLSIRPTRASRRIEVREVELVIIGPQSREEIETLIQRAIRLCIGLVDLVEHHDRAKP